MAAALAVMLGPPLVHLAAGQPADWLAWFSRGLVVLVIACPCALVIATPVAVVSALASAARHGVLVKGGQYLEEVGRLRVLAFDKTGTLTRGEPDVVEVVPADGRADDDVLRIAAALGDRGGHVLGRAIARHARERRLDVPQADDYTAYPGLGAQGQVAPSRITSAATATSTRPASACPTSTPGSATPSRRSARRSRSPPCPARSAGFDWPTRPAPRPRASWPSWPGSASRP